MVSEVTLSESKLTLKGNLIKVTIHLIKHIPWREREKY